MNWLLLGLSTYLTYYTFSMGRSIWQGGNKGAGIAIYALSGSFLPLCLYLVLR